jgi:hypothetical protein
MNYFAVTPTSISNFFHNNNNNFFMKIKILLFWMISDDNDKVEIHTCRKEFYFLKQQLRQHKQYCHFFLQHMKVKPALEFFVCFFNIRPIIILVAIISLAVCGLGVVLGPYSASAQNASSSSSAIPLNTKKVDGIQCNVSEQFLLHIHAHIDIFVDGQLIHIPSQIGIIPGKCIYWLHTHDKTGIIHIESPTKRDFTLGQFFDIWKMKVNNLQVFDKIFNGKDVPSVYINGSKVPSTINYRDIKLTPHAQIAIVYGRPPSSIPSAYNFPEGL